MDFLKNILGDELFNTVVEKINAHNGDEANKENQIKLGNLASGEYVGKGKYDALEQLLTGKSGELDTANNLIAELKKGTKGDEGLQTKITEYESKVSELQSELEQTKIKSAIKVGLLSENALDVDYLTFKLESKLKDDNKTIEIDENDNIKGWDEMISGLKTQCPNMFTTGEGGSGKKYDSKKLPGSDDDKALNKADILKKPYAERIALYNENPDAYNEAMKN